ncbi:hypothetical protein A4D02_25055 [Niastella koreensis]|uniref:DUF4595 domain-containing protein n=2 Tax=Niastella koreensis TaxID=354356 RepID=G8TR81_NIAKG|nr:hypothetical protein [Niastella koreensis]AEW00003.1 hypothetical protein Niako_3704 [Niastella koreensis GR20-10]OQP51397.1 hypothetical protein A4D02_25055 [Niastella koreensis]
MKTTIIYCYLLLLLAAVSSCGKDSANNNASHKLKTYTEDITAVGGHVVETYNVNYDEKDRITSIESTTKPGHRLVYQYSAENSFTFDKIEDNNVISHNLYFINSLSLIDSTYGYNNMRDTESVKFVYDVDKKLIKQKQYLISYLLPPVLYNTITFQYDIKGVLTKESDSYYETSYGYDKALQNTVQLEPFYFPFKEELPSHTFTTRFGTTVQTEHTYTFDDKNRLINEKAAGSDGRITIRSYTYEQ